MECTPYNHAAAFFQYARSDTFVQTNPSSWMAFSHFSLSLGRSSDMPRTVKFLSLYLEKLFTRLGLSARQGRHQLAQKSISTYLPLNEDNVTGMPLVSFCTKSGAREPTPMVFSLTIWSATFLPATVFLT